VIFMAYVGPLRPGMWLGGMWREGRGNWRNEANWRGEWLSFLGGSRYRPGSAGCAGKRCALRVARCSAKLSQQRIPRVRDGACGGRGWGVVSQNPEAVGISRVGIRHFAAMGCGCGGRFCVANRWIGRAVPGRRRDLGLGAGFWVVPAVPGIDGLACDRGGAGGVLGGTAVGFDLTLSGHGCQRGGRLRTRPTLRIEERLRGFRW
jgi:hypothetical protein